MEKVGESNLGNEIIFSQQPFLQADNISNHITTFKHESAKVHLRFTKDGTTLDDLLINYFRNLKQQ